MVGCQNYLFSFSCLSLRQLLFLVLQDWGFLRNPPVSCGSQTPPHIFSENSLSFLQCQKISNVVMRSQALDCFWLLSQWQFFYSFNFSLLEFYPREGRVCYSSPMTQVFILFSGNWGAGGGQNLVPFSQQLLLSLWRSLCQREALCLQSFPYVPSGLPQKKSLNSYNCPLSLTVRGLILLLPNTQPLAFH